MWVERGVWGRGDVGGRIRRRALSREEGEEGEEESLPLCAVLWPMQARLPGKHKPAEVLHSFMTCLNVWVVL